MSNRAIALSEPNLCGNELRYVKRCLDSGWVSSSGSFVDDFERAVCRYSRAAHAVSCVNATSGLFLALKLAGVGQGDEVILPTLTFIAPVNAVRYLGAEPVFMDCDRYLNMDTEKLHDFCKKECRRGRSGLVNRRSGRIIKAVLPVHVFGNPCDMDSIMAAAAQFSLKVVEDASESIGSYYTSGKYKGRHTGTIADLGVYSFNGNKIITTGGGGMIITSKKMIADKARYLSTQAKDDPVRSIHHEVGYNFRLTSIQSAVGLAQLEKLEDFIASKKRNYLLYRKELEDVSGVHIVQVPPGCRPNYWLYSLFVDKSQYGLNNLGLMRALAKDNIQTRPVWQLNHRQRPYIKNQAYKIERAPRLWEGILNLPSSSSLGPAEIQRITAQIKKLKRGRHG